MKKKGYLIGNAHIDPVWLWDWQEGCTEARNTFRSALERMEETEGWVFSSSSAQYYEWMEQAEPDLFAQIGERIRQGRWNVVGGWWVQPDCNLPSGESLCRQSLYGQRYFYEKFGIIAKTGYCVDSFGHNAGIVQILCKSGMKNYVFSRPGAHERELPPLFDWVGTDGEKVRAARIPIGYESNSLTELQEKSDKFERLREQSDVEQMLFFGVGNHGGGPTKEMLRWLEEVKMQKNYVYSSTDGYFESQKDRDVPEISGDLGKHAAGCYSACTPVKRANRRAENDLVAAEKLACLGSELAEKEYPADAIRNAWKRMLFYQFHDSLGGCSIRSVCESAVAAFSAASTAAGEIANAAIQRISSRVDTCGGYVPDETRKKLGKPVVLFNPSAHERAWNIRLSRFAINREGNFGAYEAVAADGERFPVQLVQGESLFWHTRDGIFRVRVPAYGYRLFYVRECEPKEGKKVCVRIEPAIFEGNTFNAKPSVAVLENSLVRFTFDPRTGSLVSVLRKSDGKQVKTNTLFTVDSDAGIDTWGHANDNTSWENSIRMKVWGYCNNAFGTRVGTFDCTDFHVSEEGEVYSSFTARYAYGKSETECVYRLYAEEDKLEISMRLLWAEKDKVARFFVPLSVESAECEVSYGHLTRKPCGEEEFSHKWIAFGGKETGLVLWNDGAYSYRVTEEGVAVVLARSAVYADHAGARDGTLPYAFLDQGESRFTFLLALRGVPDFAANTRTGIDLNEPCYPVWEGYHGGVLPVQNSFLSVSEPNVCVRVIKRAEEGTGYVVRAFETAGKECDCTLTLFQKSARVHFGANELKTVLLGEEGAEVLPITELRG